MNDTIRIKPITEPIGGGADISYMRQAAHIRAVMQHQNTARRIQGGMAEAVADPNAATAYQLHLQYGHAPNVAARFTDVV
ncbi:hypothetical protein [Streptomyces sp. NPDC096033]|uniref:hypothetical protein n=1 Tax=Streptomyces sp. NPDC096033 TaxID=3366071 RepID=UPI0038196221